MVNAREELIAETRRIAEDFVRQYHKDEEQFFPVIWAVFSERYRKTTGSKSVGLPAEALLDDVQFGLGFARHEVVDLVTPVVLATVAEALRRLREKRLSLSQAEVLVAETASEFGAAAALTAEMVRHLPGLCLAVRDVDVATSTADVSVASRPQYRIWVDGHQHIVSDISKYEARKPDFLFWIDLEERIHLSMGKPPSKALKKMALRLLLFLIERQGRRVPTREVLREVFDEDLGADEPVDKHMVNKIQQQLTALHLFSGEQFRDYLFSADFERGVGLKESFKDKYFVFSRLR